MNDSQETRRQFLFRSATAAAMAAMLGCRQTMRQNPTTSGSESAQAIEDSATVGGAQAARQLAGGGWCAAGDESR